jgi:hypothetical protein
MRRILRKETPADAPVTEAEVAEAVAGLSTTDAVEDRQTAAEADKSEALARFEAAKAAVQTAETELARQEKACREMGGVSDLDPEEIPADPGEALVAADRATEAAARSEGRARSARKKAETARAALQDCEIAMNGLEKDAAGLDNLRKDHADLLRQAPPPPESDPAPETAPSDAEAGRQVDALSESLRGLRKAFARLDRRRDETVRDTQAFARQDRFAAIRHSVGRRFREVAADHLEAEIDGWLEKLDVRLSTIRDELKAADAHRDILVRQLLQIGEEGLALLKRAAGRSMLPEDLPGMGGKRFLTVATREPASREERRVRMADLLDRFLEEGTIPMGIDLVQRTVRWLAGRTRIRILHPDPDHFARNIEIPELARLSGGEQLTGAVLLFCTLAKLRARQRGKRADRSSVLLLDNPIGHASRVRFLTIQQTIARAMGVQLIFTTGINDPESLAVFPNTIRLKNERVDRKTGNRMIEADETAEVQGRIEGVRLVRDAGDAGEVSAAPSTDGEPG